MFLQNVNTVFQTDITGPSVEFLFKRGSDASVKLGKLKTKEWDVTINPDHNKVQYINYVYTYNVCCQERSTQSLPVHSMRQGYAFVSLGR